MIDDPYKVLGITSSASQEEIKRAYRKKAKEYHPDLHPNDPQAASKMNEINEAYDMLQNPEKYKARRKQEDQRRAQAASYRSDRGYQGSQGTGHGGTGYAGYQGPGGWSSDFEEFTFEDLFGFGFGESQYNTTPRAERGDHPDLVRAINSVNSGRYQEALGILSHMTSQYRNARWHFVSASAYCGCGDSARAQDLIKKAIQLEPDNKTYRLVLRQYMSQERRQSDYTYSRTSHSPLQTVGKIMIGAAALQFIFMLMQMMFYGLMLPY